MAIPVYRGDTDATLISEDSDVNYEGLDTLIQTWELEQGDVREFIAARRMHQTPLDSISYSSTEYAGMYLKQAMPRSGGSPFSTVTLTYTGFLQTRNSSTSYASRNDSIGQMSGTVPTTSGESVSIMYYGQQTTYRWFSSSEPRSPRFPLTVPSNVPVQQIADADPATYSGSLLIKYTGRLSNFDRFELAPGKWAIVESWVRRIEPDTSSS